MVCGFYSECDGKSLKEFKQGSYIFPFKFQKNTLATVCRRILWMSIYIKFPDGVHYHSPGEREGGLD